MNFAYPEFLFALAAISVPIIIHLLNFRRFKKIYFSDIRFLKDVEIETKSRNKLKNLLILLSRILAIACLVLAFARPFIPKGAGVSSEALNSVVIYVDNSFSMNAQGEAGNMLEEAKAKAIELGSVYANGAEIRLLTNDFNPAHVRKLSFEEFKNEVTLIEATPQLRSFNDIVSRTSGMIGAQESGLLYFISDLQRRTAIPSSNSVDTLLNIFVVPTQTSVESNIYIDSCWFQTPTRLPEQSDVLMVRLRNSGTSEVENVSARLTINSVQRSVGSATIAAQSFEDIEMTFTNSASGLQFAEVSIQDYPIMYDDNYHLSFDLANNVKILLLNGEKASSHVKKVFASEANFVLTENSSANLDYSLLASTDLLVCNGVASFSSGMVQELRKFVENGGSLLFIPSEKPEFSSTNELLLALRAEQLTASDTTKLKVEGVNLKSRIFKNVFTEWEERIDLPTTSRHFGTSITTSGGAERLLTLANGQPCLSAYFFGKGSCYVLTSALQDEWTNFHRHALFVPVIYNMALNSVSHGASSETIGSDEFIALDSKIADGNKLEVRSMEDNGSFMPERVVRADGNGILVHDQVRTDGHFLIMADEDTIRPVSFNYDRTESDMNFLGIEEFQKIASDLGISNLQIVEASTETIANEVTQLQDGKQLWRLFLILGLFFLLAETILIRIL
jgi:hypothetical protein